MNERMHRAANMLSRLLFGAVLLATAATFAVNVFASSADTRSHQIEAELENLRNINANIQHRNTALANQVAALQNDSRALENMAREELGMIQHGETLFLFPPEQTEQFASVQQ